MRFNPLPSLANVQPYTINLQYIHDLQHVTTPYSKGGLGIPIEKAIQFIEYNPAYEHQAGIFKQKLGLADLAKNTGALNDNGVRKYESTCDKTENITGRGTSAQYRIAKLKRDYPEIAKGLLTSNVESQRPFIKIPIKGSSAEPLPIG